MAVLPSIQNLRSVLQNTLFVPFAYLLFYNMIPMFLTAWQNANRLQDRFQDQFRGRQNTYDFIVVGGGTAGSVVANRLSEFYTVLLIEAGGTENPLQLVPALAMNFLNQPQTDWRHKTVSQQQACLNSVNQQGSWSSGRALGGSSTLDFMSFLRGHPVDYDNWALITGDRSWSYAEVLPYFRRTEEFIGTTTDTAARGADGEMRIRQPDFIGMGDDWVRAGVEMGYTNVDLNGRYTEGFMISQSPLRRGMRQSTAAAFIRPIRLGPRLRVLRNALVTRILFRDMTNMAYGVEFERFGRTELAIASREVIVSAGTMGSPKLLMLSGIGPRQHLQDIGIPVRSDLPVGQNLQDHLGVQLGPFYITSPKSFLLDRDVTPENIVRWIVKGRGPLTTSGLQGTAAIASTFARARGEQNWPDIQLILQGQGVHRDYPEQFARAYGIQQDELVTYYANAVGRDSFNIRVIGARPTSTGSIRLSTASPQDPLVINPRYMEDNGSGDLRTLLEGVEIALRIAENTTAFNNIGTEFTRVKLPGCEMFEFRTRPYWECYIRRFTISQYNPVGTVAMGTVLDSNLKVRGTRGLRVIDASVQPTIVSVGTLASTIMIAEKGADAILREFGTRLGNGGLANAVFGRNGIINRNPIQKLLSREFDRINPLPSLFSFPTNQTGFNPFSRFLGIFGLGNGNNTSGGISSILGNIFNGNSPSLLGTLFGLGGTSNANTGTTAGSGGGGILQQLLGSLTTRSVNNQTSGGNNGNPNSILDIIFGSMNSNTNPTTPKPGFFQTLFGPRNATPANGNIFQNLFGGGGNTGTVAVTTPRPSLLGTLFGQLNSNRTSLLSTIFGPVPNGNNNTSSILNVALNSINVDNNNRTNREVEDHYDYNYNETALSYAMNQIQLAFEDNAARYGHLINRTNPNSNEVEEENV